MRFFATASGPHVRDAIRTGHLGLIATPAGGCRLEDGTDWCADNAIYAGRYPSATAYLAWLSRRARYAARCAFATAPDDVGNAAATLARSMPMLEPIRAAGYPVALVAQDGLEDLQVPWNLIDAMFLGGTTPWKLGPAAAALAAEARTRGLWVHMGRVNSRRRLHYAEAIGCHSADGTLLAFGPDRHLPSLLRWLADLTPPTSPLEHHHHAHT